MTREEAINSYKKSNEHRKLNIQVHRHIMETSEVRELEWYIERDEMAIKALERKPNHGWHPSSDAPESRGMYLVTRHYGKGDEIEIAHYTDDMRVVDEYDYADTRRGGWYRYDPEYGNYEIDNVVAWMKLPEVYKEG